MPRRVYDASYFGDAAAAHWQQWQALSAMGGVVLFVSAMCFVIVVLATVFSKHNVIGFDRSIEYTESVDIIPERATIWDRFGLWTAVAVVLVILAYAWPIWEILTMKSFGSPGFRPY